MSKEYQNALMAAVGELSFGAAIGWVSPNLHKMYDGAFGYAVDSIGTLEFISCTLLGCLVVSVPSGLLIERLGCKMVMSVSIPIYMVGWVMMFSFQTFVLDLMAFFLLGVAGGCSGVAIPVYLSEISAKSQRGVIGSLDHLFTVLGLEYAYITASLCYDVNWNAGICSIPNILQLILLFFIPKLPSYYVRKGKIEEARKVLAANRSNTSEVEDELNELIDMMGPDRPESERKMRFRLREVERKKFVIAVFLMIFQQLTGISVFYYFIDTIIVSPKSYLSGNYLQAVFGLILVVNSMKSIILVSIFPSRHLLIISGLFSLLSGYMLVIYFYGIDMGRIPYYDWLDFILVLSYGMAYSLGFGPLPTAVACELFPVNVRSFLMGVAMSIKWLFAMLAVSVFSKWHEGKGSGLSFFCILLCNAIFVNFVINIVPETLESAQEERVSYGRKLTFA